MKMSRQRVFQSSVLMLALIGFCWIGTAQLDGADRVKHDTDDLFTRTVIPHLRIEISPEGMEILRHYEFDINDLMDRTNVLATVREGTTLYTNVASKLVRSIKDRKSTRL